MQASVNERELVLDMLLQITRDGEYSHIVIKNVLDKYQYLGEETTPELLTDEIRSLLTNSWVPA